MYRRSAIAAILSAGFLLTGCERPADSSSPSTRSQPAIAPANEATSLRMGVIPVEGGADVMRRFEPVVAHLSAALQREVNIRPASSYNAVVIALANKQLDFGYFGPKSYVEAARRANAEAVAMELNEAGEPGYRSIIIARADSGIESLDDGAGKRFGYTDANSTSGCLIPRVLFYRDRKQRPEDFFATPIKFTGSHANAIIQVKNNHLDLAATNTIDLSRAVASGNVAPEELRIVWESDMIPGAAIAVRADLPDELKQAIGAALLDFRPTDSQRENLAAAGYVTTSDSDYDVIRYLIQRERELARETANQP